VTALEVAGVSQAGMARTATETGTIEPVDVHGVRVGHLSYTFSFNGLRLPAGEPWRSNLIDAQRIRADASRLRAAGAVVVIVSLHWGNEGDRPSPRTSAESPTT
jgi:poly-gamma-glutamate synthesis protein (capsule biosynthesis protein)